MNSDPEGMRSPGLNKPVIVAVEGLPNRMRLEPAKEDPLDRFPLPSTHVCHELSCPPSVLAEVAGYRAREKSPVVV